KDETLRDVAAAPEMIEDHHAADEKAVGSTLKHRSVANEHGGVDDGDFVEFLAHLVNAREVFGELLHGVGAGEIVKRSLGFADVCKRAFDVRANNGLTAWLIQTSTQGDIGGLQPHVECVTDQVGG